jgi:hypothetical protein
MKIKELLGEAGAVATIKDYKPGQSLSFTDQEGSTMTTIDLKKNPMAVKPDEQGNLSYDPTPDSQAAVPGQSQAPEIKPGAQIQIDTATTEQSQDAEAPPMPNIDGIEAGQSKDLGNGEKLTLKQDGTVSYMGAFGEYIYDNTGTVIKHNSPTFAGYSKSKDLKTGQTAQSYNAGPLSIKQGPDGSSEVEYDLGPEKLKGTVNSGRMDEFAYITGLAKRVSGTDAKVTKSAAKDVFDIKRLAGL